MKYCPKLKITTYVETLKEDGLSTVVATEEMQKCIGSKCIGYCDINSNCFDLSYR